MEIESGNKEKERILKIVREAFSNCKWQVYVNEYRLNKIERSGKKRWKRIEERENRRIKKEM